MAGRRRGRYPPEYKERIVELVFATGIKRAYDNTCAISGLRIINGGGRAEAQAAHIRPVGLHRSVRKLLDTHTAIRLVLSA